MFIMNKDKTVIIKPTTIWLSQSEKDGMLNISASNGNKNYILGTYDTEYANEEFENIFENLNGKLESIYTMSNDEDVKEYYNRKQFNPRFGCIDDDDIPF